MKGIKKTDKRQKSIIYYVTQIYGMTIILKTRQIYIFDDMALLMRDINFWNGFSVIYNNIILFYANGYLIGIFIM